MKFFCPLLLMMTICVNYGLNDMIHHKRNIVVRDCLLMQLNRKSELLRLKGGINPWEKLREDAIREETEER